MFENFSKKFESVFRTVFIVWVCFWGFINLLTLLFQYVSFAGNGGDDLIRWWFSILGQVVTITLGILLLFMMSNIPSRILKRKRITTIPVMIFMTVVYYLFVTCLELVSNAIFSPENFARDFIFTTAWLMPSIVLLVIHLLYYNNLMKYNEELTEGVQS